MEHSAMAARPNAAAKKVMQQRRRVALGALTCRYVDACTMTAVTSPVVAGMTWHAQAIELTPVDEDGYPTCSAALVPGTITLVDRHGHPIASHEVSDLVGALRALADGLRAPMRSVETTREPSVRGLDMARTASAALTEVEDWILATLYVPVEWYS